MLFQLAEFGLLKVVIYNEEDRWPSSDDGAEMAHGHGNSKGETCSH